MSLDRYLELLAEANRNNEATKLAYASMSDEELLKVAKHGMPHFTDQDRPKKVKEIYRAIKRDHPEMPAAMKARIASRQGKKGKQHQGPPYKGPLTKTAFLPGAIAGAMQAEPGERGAGAGWGAVGGLAGGILGGLAGMRLGGMNSFMLGIAGNVLGGLALSKYMAKLKKEELEKEKAKNMAASNADVKTAAVDKEAFLGAALKAIKAAPGAIAGKAKQVASTYQAGANPLGKGAVGPLLPGQSRGVGAGLKAVATQHPGVTAGAVGAAGLGTGYAIAPSQNKTAAMLLEIGDKAGRILAKAAAIPMEELQESIEEAHAREDVPGRARRTALAGGLAGGSLAGLAGAAGGYGVGKLTHTPRLGAVVGGALGATGGGIGGARFGKQHGAQEAEADKILSALRAARAAQMGYGAGVQRGYQAGMQGVGE
jgi:hypothetical protein